MLQTKPESVLALDYGEKRVGLSLSSLIARLAHPLTTLSNDEELLNNLKKIIEEENVIYLVVGYPRGMEGQITKQTKTTETFAEELKAKFNLPVDLQDESLTSVKAETELMNKDAYSKEDVDALAATYILSDWLDLHDKIDELKQ
jgi:putative Holliday junction resolvase